MVDQNYYPVIIIHSLQTKRKMITIPEVNSQNSTSVQFISFQSSRTKRPQLLSICQKLVKQTTKIIEDRIQEGEVKIRNKPLHIQSKINDEKMMSEGDIRDKISSLNGDLKSLQERIHQEKEEQRLKEYEKKKEAGMMIERLKREKQEYRNKIKFNEVNQRLKSSVFSEEVLSMMKEHREKMLNDKRKDMESRINQNLHRKANREEENVKKQLDYWNKVKQIQGKRHHSTKILPKISQSNNHQLGVNLRNDYVIPRKGSLLSHKKSASKQDLTDYQKLVNRYLERAKAKRQNFSERSPKESRISDEKKPEMGREYDSMKVQGQKMKKIILSYNDNKHKRIGDEYLKQSLLRVNKSPKRSKADEDALEESIELKGNAAFIFKNDKQASLQQQWEKILQKAEKKVLDRERAVEMLREIEKKLDRIDPSNIQTRLRRKLFTLQQLKKNQSHRYSRLEQSIKNNEFEESSEHGI